MYLAFIELPAAVSDAIRPGVVVVAQGWGSRVFDPTGREEPMSSGANRNLLVNNAELDPLSQISPLNSQAVRVDRVVRADGKRDAGQDSADECPRA